MARKAPATKKVTKKTDAAKEEPADAVSAETDNGNNSKAAPASPPKVKASPKGKASPKKNKKEEVAEDQKVDQIPTEKKVEDKDDEDSDKAASKKRKTAPKNKASAPKKAKAANPTPASRSSSRIAQQEVKKPKEEESDDEEEEIPKAKKSAKSKKSVPAKSATKKRSTKSDDKPKQPKMEVFQLPKGWKVGETERSSGKSAGRKDKTYYGPNGEVFRSLVGVQRHVAKYASF